MRPRSRAFAAAVAGALLALASLPPAGAAEPTRRAPRHGLEVGNLAHDFTLTDLRGRAWRLESLRGRKVVQLVFWASWCVPCMREIPALRTAHARHSAKGLEILGVVLPINQTARIAEAIARDFEIPYTVLFDADGRVMERYQVYAIPQNYLIGKDGVIRHAGVDLPEDYDALVGRLLSEGGAPAAAGAPAVPGPTRR